VATDRDVAFTVPNANKDYAYGEKAYIVLSLVSKSALGWIIVLGTMGV
jgi:hypothetical protein